MEVIDKPSKKKNKMSAVVDAVIGTDNRRVVVPLSRLVLSKKYNVRKIGGKVVGGLAALIEAQGLLQPLLIVEEIIDGVLTGNYEVIAGGRRWRALNLLTEQGKIGKDEPIECKLMDSDNAVEISYAENSEREDMHPADQFDAFKRLAAEGKTVEQIAFKCGVSPLTVMRRLKLANVSPVLMEKFKEGEIDIRQLEALAITDDHEKQEMVWNNSQLWERENPDHLRRMLTENEIDAKDHPLALFVGIEAYEAAGGTLRRDLFSEDGTGGYITDMPLLHKLANEKLQAEVENVKAEGWSWVEVRETFTHSDRVNFGTLPMTSREPDPEEQARLDALEAKSVELSAKIEQLGEDDEAEYEKIEQELADIDEQIEKLNESLCAWTDEAKAHSGAVITVNQHGQLDIKRGLVLPTDRKAAAVALSTTNSALGGMPQHAKPEIPEKLMLKLSSHRTAALQAALMANHTIALVTLAHALAVSTFSRFYDIPEVKVRGTSSRHSLKSHANDMIGARAWLAVEAQIEVWEEKLPQDKGELFGWLMDLPTAELMELLALCTAVTIDATTGSSNKHPAVELAAALNLDMADWWSATSVSYFENVPKVKIIEAVAEACGMEATVGMDKMKKGEAVKAAEQRIEGKRWLPKPLRA